MHANNPMCHVSMYNQILSSAAGPCGKLAKLAEMRSENTANNDALSSNAGHGDAEGITQPKSDARCTATEDFFQSSSNFMSALAALTTTETRALVAARPNTRRDQTTHASSVTSAHTIDDHTHTHTHTHRARAHTHRGTRDAYAATRDAAREPPQRAQPSPPYLTRSPSSSPSPHRARRDAPRRHLTRESNARNPYAYKSPPSNLPPHYRRRRRRRRSAHPRTPQRRIARPRSRYACHPRDIASRRRTCRATFVRITGSRYHTSHVPFALVVARNVRAGRVSAREFNASAFIGRDNGVRGRRRPGVHLYHKGLESYGVTTKDDHTFSMWSKV